MRNLDRIDTAIADLNTQEVPNVSATARKYDIEGTTLRNRLQGKSTSMADHISQRRQCLTNAEESSLIQIINKLTDRNIPPTASIVKNLAEEIRGSNVGKNWTANFVRRHQDKLRSIHLSNIDNLRVKNEHPASYKYFYQLVELIFLFVVLL
jgi:Tc5 transposase DNA-binding domain